MSIVPKTLMKVLQQTVPETFPEATQVRVTCSDDNWTDVEITLKGDTTVMSVEAMRAILKTQYGGAYKWVNRVNKMGDNQIVAVYYRMLNSGQLKS